MKPPTNRQLLRLLRDELAPRERQLLEAAMRQDSSLAERYRELERVWRSLDAAPESELGGGFDLASAVLERARGERSSWTPSWDQLSAAWRTATVVATAAGIAGGVLLAPSRFTDPELESFAAQPSLAASYLLAFEEALEQIEVSAGTDTEEQP